MTFQAIIYLNFYFDFSLQTYIITPKDKSNTTLRMIRVKYLTETSAECGMCSVIGSFACYQKCQEPKRDNFGQRGHFARCNTQFTNICPNFLILANQIISTCFNLLLHSQLQRTEFQRFYNHRALKCNFHTAVNGVHRYQVGIMGKLKTYLLVTKSGSQTRKSKIQVYILVFCRVQ